MFYFWYYLVDDLLEGHAKSFKIKISRGVILSMEAQNFADTWVDAVNKKSVPEILALYDTNATLLPTFSAVPAKGHTAIETYFMRLLTHDSVGVDLQSDSLGIDLISDNISATYGTYTFSYYEKGSQKVFPARFTFLLNMQKSSPILHHHSSLIP